MLAKGLSPADKTYIWKTLIFPALSFGCSIAPLGPADMERLGKLQASCIKTAFGLPRTAHHSGLLAASGIPAIHEAARGQIFRAYRSAMSSNHRLQQILITSLAKLAVSPSEVEGSFLMHIYTMCNNSFRAVMELAAGGPVDSDRVCAARMPDGLADSLQFVLQGNCEASRRLLRLLTCYTG